MEESTRDCTVKMALTCSSSLCGVHRDCDALDQDLPDTDSRGRTLGSRPGWEVLDNYVTSYFGALAMYSEVTTWNAAKHVGILTLYNKAQTKWYGGRGSCNIRVYYLAKLQREDQRKEYGAPRTPHTPDACAFVWATQTAGFNATLHTPGMSRHCHRCPDMRAIVVERRGVPHIKVFCTDEEAGDQATDKRLSPHAHTHTCTYTRTHPCTNSAFSRLNRESLALLVRLWRTLTARPPLSHWKKQWLRPVKQCVSSKPLSRVPSNPTSPIARSKLNRVSPAQPDSALHAPALPR